VFFDAAGGWIETPVYWRADLAPADELHGPAVIEEFGSTVPLHPGFVATVDELANILVRREASQ
jgi:N-methylhydantoinase A